MIVVNFSHPLTPDQLPRIAAETGSAPERVIDVPAQFEGEPPFGEQVRALVDGVGLSPAEWQTLPLLVNPPAFAPIAAVVLAHLHALIGHFPPTPRIGPVGDAVPPRFVVAEVIDLNAVRDAARRGRWPEGGAG
jgi:hypothetical protein